MFTEVVVGGIGIGGLGLKRALVFRIYGWAVKKLGPKP